MRRWPWWSWRARAAGDGPRAPTTDHDGASAATPHLQIHCFGGFVVEYAGRLLCSRERALEWQLLAYLAVHPADGVTRAELVQAVWGRAVPPDSSRVNAALCRLRRLLQDQAPGLCSTVVTSHRDGRVSLDTAAIGSDAQQAWRVLATAPGLAPDERHAAVARLRALAAAPLLEGCRWPWLQQRDADGRTLGQRLVTRLEALAQLDADEAADRRRRWTAPNGPGRRRPAQRRPGRSISAPPFPC